MDCLPSDIVIQILSRLPVKSLLRCRCVCKSWLALTHDLALLKAHLSLCSQDESNSSLILKTIVPRYPVCQQSCRLLMIENDGLIDEYKCVKVPFSVPNLKSYEVYGSSNGLLCLFSPSAMPRVLVLNPCTGDYTILPNPIREYGAPIDVMVGFGYSPKGHEFKVIEIAYHTSDIDPENLISSSMCLYTLGDSSWRHIGEAPSALQGRISSQASVNGALHWVSSGYDGARLVDRIVAFDLQDECFRIIPHPDFECRRSLKYVLGVLKGCLSATNLKFQDYVEIWIMKEYGMEESWSKCLKIVCAEVGFMIGEVRPLFFQKNGELLLLYGATLLSYNPMSKKLRELRIPEMPRSFGATFHVGSLLSPAQLPLGG